MSGKATLFSSKLILNLRARQIAADVKEIALNAAFQPKLYMNKEFV
jgi:hypothetical protein